MAELHPDKKSCYIFSLAADLLQPIADEELVWAHRAIDRARRAVEAEQHPLGRIGPAEAASLRLAASDYPRVDADEPAMVNAAFVEVQTGLGVSHPLWVRAQRVAQGNSELTLRTTHTIDPGMRASVESAFREAAEVAGRVDPAIPTSSWIVDWGVEAQASSAKLEGASLGLAFGLAAFASLLNLASQPLQGLLITGALDRHRVIGVSKVAQKWDGVRERGFDRFMLPPASVPQLPQQAKSSPSVRLLVPTTLEAAVYMVFGETLAATRTHLAAASDASVTAPKAPQIDLWLEAGPGHATLFPPAATSRGLRPAVRHDPNPWQVGDRLAIVCLAQQDCQLLLLVDGPDEPVTVAVPGVLGDATPLAASRPHRIDVEFDSAGPHRLVALALSEQPSPQRISEINTADSLDAVVQSLGEYTLAKDRIAFDVHPAGSLAGATARSLGSPAPQPLARQQWQSEIFG